MPDRLTSDDAEALRDMASRALEDMKNAELWSPIRRRLAHLHVEFTTAAEIVEAFVARRKRP
jgi:hypothetical protein